MNTLFFIDRSNHDIKKLSEYYSAGDNISIFSTSYLDKLKWRKNYPVFYYDDLGIDARNGFFKELLPKSYKLTYQLLDACLSSLNLEEDRKDLVSSIPSRLHRVVSECLRAEKTIDKIMDYFNPKKVYVLDKKSEVFHGTINSNVNFEPRVLKQFCRSSNINYESIFLSPEGNFKGKMTGYLKKLKRAVKNYLKKSPSIISRKILPNIDRKPIIIVYLFEHHFYRNQAIWKYFNNDKEHYYLFVTDWLSNEHRELLEKNVNLSFIHIKGLLPLSREIPQEKIDKVTKVVSACLQNNEPCFSRDIISYYLANYVFGYYDTYLENHKLLKSFVKKYSPSLVIFPSYWEVQPSLLISYCRKNNIPTTAIQAGIHPREATEISLTDRYGMFGKWDYENFVSSGYDEKQLFILGWPLGEFYKTGNYLSKKNKSQQTEILLLLSMAGSWQYFLYFPEDLIISELIEIAEKFPEMNFTIRVHSGNNIAKFRSLIEYNNIKNVKLSTSGSLIDILLKTDYTFTQYTTTAGFESMMLDIPTFCLNLHAYEDASFFCDLGQKYIANSKDELFEILSHIENNADGFLGAYQERKERLLDKIFSRELVYYKLLNYI